MAESEVKSEIKTEIDRQGDFVRVILTETFQDGTVLNLIKEKEIPDSNSIDFKDGDLEMFIFAAHLELSVKSCLKIHQEKAPGE